MADQPHSTLDFQAPSTGSEPWPTLTQVDSKINLLQVSVPLPTVPGYSIVGEVGRGGMGIVYKARDLRLNRDVAIKMVLADEFASQERLLRFLLEAETAAQVKHPHVIQVYEAGEHAGKLFLVTEFVTGGTLHKRLGGASMPPRQAAELLAKLADAVAALHAHGVLHRDLKPANVLLDDQNQPKVTDFGLAKRLGDSEAKLTNSGLIVGTPEYMAPEQAQGRKDVGTAADLYALGVIFYECLTGKTPFHGESPMEAMMKIMNTEAVPPSRITAGIPRDLEVICMKCLSKDPARRYPTAAALGDDLRRYLEGQPVQARPVSTTERVWRWCRRNPLSAGLATAAVLAMIGAIVGTSWGWQRAVEAEADARQAALTAVKAQKDAEGKQKQAETIAELLESLFSEMDPTLDRINDQSLREQLLTQLNEAVKKLDKQFDGDPLLRAGMQAKLAKTLLNLGDSKQAEQLFQAAVTTQRAELGDEDLSTLITLNNLAMSMRDNGKYTEAEALFQKIYDARCRVCGKDHEHTFITLNNLASTKFRNGKMKEAVPLLEQVYEHDKNTLGEQHKSTLLAANNLGAAYRQTGDLNRALKLLEPVRKQFIELYGPHHVLTLSVSNNLAGAYRALGRSREAVPLLEEVLAERTAKLGKDHPDALRTLNALALSYNAMGRSSEGTKLLEQSKELYEKKLGPDHPDTLLAINNLASQYLQVGRVKDAVPYLEPLRAKFIKTLGEESTVNMTHAHNTAMCLRSLGRNEESLNLLEQLHKLKVKVLGKDHPETLTTLVGLSQAYLMVNRMDDAIQRSEEVRDLSVKKLGTDHPATLEKQENLAGMYRGAGRCDDAIVLLELVREKRSKVLGPDHPQTLGAMQKLASTNQAGKRWHAAQIAWTEYMIALEKQKPVNEKEVAGAQAGQAACLLVSKEYDKAAEFFKLSLAYRQKQEPNAWSTSYTKSQLGYAYLQQKKYAEAEPLLLAAWEGMKSLGNPSKTPLNQPSIEQRDETLQRLVLLYTAMNKPEEVKKWQGLAATSKQ